MKPLLSEVNIPYISETDIKLKIKSTRTRYMAELNKVLQSEKIGTGRDDIYVPKVLWFAQADALLRPVSMSNRSSSNLKFPGLAEGQGTEVYVDNEENIQETDLNTKHTNDDMLTEITENDVVRSDATRCAPKKRGKKSHAFEESSVERAVNSFKKLQKITEFHNKQATLTLNLICFAKASSFKQQKLQSVMTHERLRERTSFHQAMRGIIDVPFPIILYSNMTTNTYSNNDYSIGTPQSLNHPNNADPPEWYLQNDILSEALHRIADM